MDRKIRIAHAIYGLKYGGAEKLLVPLSSRIDRERFHAIVVALTCGGPVEDDLRREGVDVRVMRRDARFGPRDLLALIALLRRERIDIVHTHLQNADILAGLAAKACGVKQVSTFHGIVHDAGPVGTLKLRLRVRLPDRIIAVSAATAKTCVDEFGARRDKVGIVYNGLDSDSFFPPVKVEPRQETILATVGRLEEEKGNAFFLEALSQVRKVRTNVMGMVIGDGSLRGALERQAAELGLKEAVHFLGDRNDVPDLLRIVDIVVIPSISEGLSLVALEAMACGKPVVATRVGGIPELIDDGTNGLLVPPADPRALARSVLELAGDGDLRERMGSHGRAKVMGQFSLETMIRGIERVYLSLVEGGARGDS